MPATYKLYDSKAEGGSAFPVDKFDEVHETLKWPGSDIVELLDQEEVSIAVFNLAPGQYLKREPKEEGQ